MSDWEPDVMAYRQDFASGERAQRMSQYDWDMDDHVVEPGTTEFGTSGPAAPLDPRAENCRGYRIDGNGKVTGVLLQVLERPNTRYRLEHVELIDEERARGQTIAAVQVYDRSGRLTPERVFLAWPWAGSDHLPNAQLPGNVDVPAKHMITNNYKPGNAVGPLAIYVGSGKDSDIVGGLGLPFNRHVSYYLVFRERGAAERPGPDPSPEPPFGSEAFKALRKDVDENTKVLKRLQAVLADWLEGLNT